MRQQREDWFRYRIPAVSARPERGVFLDETSVKTNLIRLRGWALRGGDRLGMDAPFGSGGTPPGRRPFGADLIHWIQSVAPLPLYRGPRR